MKQNKSLVNVSTLDHFRLNGSFSAFFVFLSFISRDAQYWICRYFPSHFCQRDTDTNICTHFFHLAEETFIHRLEFRINGPDLISGPHTEAEGGDNAPNTLGAHHCYK